MGMRKRNARVMLEALLYDATKMLQGDMPPKVIHEFLTTKLDRDFKGSTFWKVDWTGRQSYGVIAPINYRLCPLCNQSQVNDKGECLSCGAECSKEDLIAINEVEHESV